MKEEIYIIRVQRRLPIGNRSAIRTRRGETTHRVTARRESLPVAQADNKHTHTDQHNAGGHTRRVPLLNSRRHGSIHRRLRSKCDTVSGGGLSLSLV